MKRLRLRLRLSKIKFSKKEPGMILIIALALLAVLAMVGTMAVRNSTTDIKIGSNYKRSTEALYVAQAGIEHAKAILAQTTLNDALGTTTGIFAGDVTVFGNGSYTVALVNDDDDSDDDGSSDDDDSSDAGSSDTDDDNNIVYIYGTGTVAKQASVTLEVKVLKTTSTLPDFAGAVNLVDPDVEIGLNSASVDIYGDDYYFDPGPPAKAKADTTGVSKHGIAVQDSSPDENIHHNADITGSGGTDDIDYGNTDVTLAELQSLRTSLLASSGLVTYSGSLTINSSNISTYPLGSSSAPQITYINGSLDINGQSGAGILIVDEDLDVSGGFIFEGLVLVGVCDTCPGRFESGSGGADIYGSVIVANPTSSHSDEARIDLSGGANIYYSTQGLSYATSLLDSSVTVMSWREIH